MNCTADLWTGCGLDDALTPSLDRTTVGEQVEHLLAVLPPRFALGGLSLGAVVAAELALAAPDRVTALVLASVNPGRPTPAQRASWRRWCAALDAGTSARQLQAGVLDALVPPDVAAARPDLVARVLAMGSDEHLLRCQLAQQDSRCGLLDRLPRLRVPPLVVSGARDVLCPPEFHARLAGAVPGAEVVGLPTGHLVPLEAPVEFGELVRARVG
nr:alpha/beta fold hydrolase [Kineococcus aurantiacus]